MHLLVELAMSAKRSFARMPAQRLLRVFAFDPGARARLDTASISEVTLKVAWEKVLDPGPVGEYLEVVDYDPASGGFYAPVDLNDPYVLAQDGLAPSEGGPQFHQQMVYAVAMNTIDHFEQALGRVSLWSPRIVRDERGKFVRADYVQRLRIYPHALREANAYYSPAKKALLFGYFPAAAVGAGQKPGGMIFTAASFDIVAHETTHALLDGLHPSFNEPTNPDVHALHEGFADVVALLQRFAHAEILEHQIARTRGNLEQQNLLGELAQEFGQAIGMRGSLRSALGKNDASGRWTLEEPDPAKFAAATEPHARGEIFLAAVFRAFLAIYKMRSEDLLRIASNGTGILREGAIHPDLVRRLAREAASAAQAVLTMCIRGLDYCPPVDVDFGCYLRAVVTGDTEVWPEETYPYRLAFIEAFRQWGIYPGDVRGMSESDLRYPRLDEAEEGDEAEGDYDGSVRELFKKLSLGWGQAVDRETVWDKKEENGEIIHAWLSGESMRSKLSSFGLTTEPTSKKSVYVDRTGRPTLEVHSVRIARRRGFRGSRVTNLVVEVRQRRRGYFDPDVQKRVDEGGKTDQTTDFRFRRGCTLIIDPERRRVRYVIRTKGDVNDDAELNRVRQILTGESDRGINPFYGSPRGIDLDDEHFAVLHRRHAAIRDFDD